MAATITSAAVRAYFATPRPHTDLSAHAAHVRELPAAVLDLCRVVSRE